MAMTSLKCIFGILKTDISVELRLVLSRSRVPEKPELPQKIHEYPSSSAKPRSSYPSPLMSPKFTMPPHPISVDSESPMIVMSGVEPIPLKLLKYI